MLKNRETNKELFVVVISLLPTEEAKTKFGAAGAKENAKQGDSGKGDDNDDLD